MSDYSSSENERVKEALDRMSKVAAPVVTDLLTIAQRGVAETLAALQRAQASVPDIADAAVNLGAAHADLLAAATGRNNNKS